MFDHPVVVDLATAGRPSLDPDNPAHLRLLVCLVYWLNGEHVFAGREHFCEPLLAARSPPRQQRQSGGVTQLDRDPALLSREPRRDLLPAVGLLHEQLDLRRLRRRPVIRDEELLLVEVFGPLVRLRVEVGVGPDRNLGAEAANKTDRSDDEKRTKFKQNRLPIVRKSYVHAIYFTFLIWLKSGRSVL